VEGEGGALVLGNTLVRCVGALKRGQPKKRTPKHALPLQHLRRPLNVQINQLLQARGGCCRTHAAAHRNGAGA
jgi:hypothetical protein